MLRNCEPRIFDSTIKRNEIMTTSKTVNGTTYTSFEVNVKGYNYSVLKVQGNHNYYSVKQINHVRGLGKDFKTFDEMLANYKSIQMKAALMQIVK